MDHPDVCPHCGVRLTHAEARAAASDSHFDPPSSEDLSVDLDALAAVQPGEGFAPPVVLSEEPPGPAPFEFVPAPGLAGLNTSTGEVHWPGSIAAEPTGLGSQPSGLVEDTPRRSWGRLLLGSYASALTMALVWMMATGRIQLRAIRPNPADGNVGVAEAEAAPVANIPVNRRIALGQELGLGQIEVTPLEVYVDRVDLRNETSEAGAYRNGGLNALILRLRVRNTSTEREIAPLEAGMVRVADGGLAESLILSDGDRIQMYPLPLTSEWSIDGQTFPAIRPGEEHEYLLVSEPECVARIGASLNWRFRIRVAPGQTELLEVGLTRGDIRYMALDG